MSQPAIKQMDTSAISIERLSEVGTFQRTLISFDVHWSFIVHANYNWTPDDVDDLFSKIFDPKQDHSAVYVKIEGGMGESDLFAIHYIKNGDLRIMFLVETVESAKMIVSWFNGCLPVLTEEKGKQMVQSSYTPDPPAEFMKKSALNGIGTIIDELGSKIEKGEILTQDEVLALSALQLGLKKLKLGLVLNGKLNGMQGKEIAAAMNLTPGRISQMLKEAQEDDVLNVNVKI